MSALMTLAGLTKINGYRDEKRISEIIYHAYINDRFKYVYEMKELESLLKNTRFLDKNKMRKYLKSCGKTESSPFQIGIYEPYTQKISDVTGIPLHKVKDLIKKMLNLF